MQRTKAPLEAGYRKRFALVLQGGGALGSYQAGVYEALAASPYRPGWIAGISIGAINAAIIAGNAPERRVEKLRTFWERVTEPHAPWSAFVERAYETVTGEHHSYNAASTMLYGQRGFFVPRDPLDWMNGFASGALPVSFYETAPLRETLEELVDFDRINSREIRFSVGAVNVRTGNFAYFDNAEITIRPEHVMASGALPPGFPAVEIDGEQYWDGGLVSNTPLQYLVEYTPRRSHLVFQVDVFHASGRLPTTLAEVEEREKDIRYSSRTRQVTDTLKIEHDIRHNINAVLAKLPDELRRTPEAEWLYRFSCVTTMDVAHLIYRPTELQGHSKDYEFSRRTMEERWASGLADAEETLAASPWLEPAAPEIGLRTFDVVGRRLARERHRAR